MQKVLAIFILSMCLVLSCVLEGDKKITSDSSTTTTPKNKGDDTVNLDDYNALFNIENLHQIDIVISRSEWDGLVQDMLDYKSKYNSLRSDNYRKANFIYKGKAGDKTIEEIAIRTRGNTTRVIPENPKGSGNYFRSHFSIKFNKTFSLTEGTTEYEKRKDRRFSNLRGLNLKFQDFGDREGDPSLFREIYSYDLLNKMQIKTPKVGVTRLYIKVEEVDGSVTSKYFGIYALIEPVDKSFLTRRYGKDQNDGNLYKCLWQQNGPATLESTSGKLGVKNWKTNYRPSIALTTNDDTPNYSDIQTFVSKLNSEGLSYLENNFVMDQFVRWLAGNFLLGMPDDYWSMGNNYYLYFNNVTGKCEFFPYDYDHGLGGGWNGGVGYDKIKNAEVDKWFYQAGGNRTNRPLVDKILSDSANMAKYKDYLKEFIKPENKLFNYDDYLDKFNKFKTMISPYLSDVVNGAGTMTLSINNESFVKDYFDGKIYSVSTQLGLTATTTSTSTTTTTINLGYTSPEFTETNVIFRYKYTGSDPLVVRGSFNSWGYDTTNWRMTDSGTDNIYELTKPKSVVTNNSQYKFYYGSSQDGGTWVQDPANPDKVGDGGNSIVVYP